MPTESVVLLQGSRFRVERVTEVSEAGKTTVREIVRHPGAVTILPLVGPGQVCLIRNRRIAVDQTLIELPAGTLEPGEDPEVTARRELAEETGYEAQSLEHLTSFFLSPGIIDERMHLYLATGLTAGSPHREEGEQIENLVVPYAEALEMVFDGRIQDAKSIVGLLFCQRLQLGRGDGKEN